MSNFVLSVRDCVYVAHSGSDAQRALLSIIQIDNRWPYYIKIQAQHFSADALSHSCNFT